MPAQIQMELHPRAQQMLPIAIPRAGLQILRDRVPWVKVDRDIQLLHRSPELVVVGGVEIHLLPRVLAFRLEVINQTAKHTQLSDSPAQLAGGVARVVHGEGGQGAEAFGVLCDFGGEVVVCGAGEGVGFGWVGLALRAGGREGEEHVVDAVGVHLRETGFVDVEEALFVQGEAAGRVAAGAHEGLELREGVGGDAGWVDDGFFDCYGAFHFRGGWV